ncbi:hypothetical protein K2Y11_13465 [bacterium]|nr:hypothetical protein [bacterium]
MLWTCSCDALDDRTHRYRLCDDEVSLSVGRVIRLWVEEKSFRTYFTQLLADSPFTAFRWENPPLTRESGTNLFEFVLIDRPSIDRPADGTPFKKYFEEASPSRNVTSFASLGKDATLIVPLPRGPRDAYPHLGAFVRSAPTAQRDELWSVVGSELERQLGTKPIWLSTAGAGVPWLHVRLDQTPKYFSFEPYRKLN